jgi:hypothetical protein
MSTMLRRAAALFLSVSIAGAACAATDTNAFLTATPWDAPIATYQADDIGLVNPLEPSAIELASSCEATCGESACCDDACCDGACDDQCAGDCLGCGDACDCGDMCGCGPVWYASAGMVILKRDRPSPGTVIAANPGGAPFSSASDFSFDYEAGFNVALARRFGDTILEGRYFGVDSTDTNNLVAPGNFIGAGFTGPGGTSFTGKYLTMLDSTEINLRRNLSDRVSILGGFRWVELKDEMFYKLNGNVATGDYEYNNRLYGGQIGAAFNAARPSSRWIGSVEGKAGIYGNVVDGGIYEFQGNNFIGSFVDQSTTTSFVGEVDLTLGYRLTPHIILSSGYKMLWLGDVSLAGEAASRSLLNPSLLRSNRYEDLFYQGATASIDFVW